MTRIGQRRLIWGLAGLATAAVPTGSAPAANDQEIRIRAFKPVADAYVSSVRPDDNFGKAKVLRVDGAPELTSYLRFELGRIRGEISSVTLLLHPSTAARARVAVRRVYVEGWRERRLTYDTAPRTSSRYAASRPLRRGVWSAIDVTPFVREEDGDVSLAITTRAARGLSFGSRESRYAPRLVIRTEGKLDDTTDLIAEALGLP